MCAPEIGAASSEKNHSDVSTRRLGSKIHLISMYAQNLAPVYVKRNQTSKILDNAVYLQWQLGIIYI